jgi:hypothetical protein
MKNYFEPRNLTPSDFIVIFCLIALIIIACGGGVLVINLLRQRSNVPATPIPTSVPVSTPVEQAIVVQPTPTVTVPAPTVVNTPTRTIGESCKYSEAWINQSATPIPDGGYSAFQGYSCVNGYWDLGIGDWIDGSGNWGKDGSTERELIKYNADGVIIDIMFFDLNGNRIPGPIN